LNKVKAYKGKIREILKNTITKNTFYNLHIKNPIPIYQAIIDTKSLPYEEFENRFHKFLKTYKESFNKAADDFCSFLYEKSQPVYPRKIPKLANKIKGFKKERKDDLRYTRSLYEYFFDEGIPYFHSLITFKNYRLENYFNEDESCSYILGFYGFSDDDYLKDAELRERCKSTNKLILKIIKTLKSELEFAINNLFNDNKVPNAKTWFVDVFKEAPERYLPDWKKYQRRSRNQPNFEKSYGIFEKFIKGKSSKELGYGNKYHKLRYEVIPQGLIVFLYLIDRRLYKIVDQEKKLLKEKTRQIRDILNAIPNAKAHRLLSALLKDYHAPLERTGLLNIRKDLLL